MPKVYNKNHRDAPPGAVYVGRGSVYGNPYQIGANGDGREDVIRKYKTLLDSRPAVKATFARQLKGKDLVCFCAPKDCHADYLLEIANKEED